MRQIVNWIIYDKNWNILVVDKEKDNWNTLTILPWGKIEENENILDALKREIKEELWLKNIQIEDFIWNVEWYSPTSNIKSNIHIYKVTILGSLENMKAENEVKNPRFLNKKVILSLENTTKLTKTILNKL